MPGPTAALCRLHRRLHLSAARRVVRRKTTILSSFAFLHPPQVPGLAGEVSLKRRPEEAFRLAASLRGPRSIAHAPAGDMAFALLRSGGLSTGDMLNWGVTVDGVMGGRSEGTTRVEGSTVLFQGNINTNGGGFAYMTRSINSADISQYQGISLELGSLDATTVGNSPIGFEVELEGSNGCCGLSAAFAVPATAGAGESATAFLPKGDFKTKGGAWWSDRCSCYTDWTAVKKISIAVYYQEGPFALDLRGLTATEAVAADQLVTPPLPPSPGIATSLTAALARADYVHAKGQGGGGGVRAEQMAALAVAILETAALQAGGVESAAQQQLLGAAAASQAARRSAPSPPAVETLAPLRAEVLAAVTVAGTSGSGSDSCELAQYATATDASSAYQNYAWSAVQATGAPTHSGCSTGLSGSWAPGPQDTQTHTLTLDFGALVYAEGVRVWEHANPASASGFVKRVDAIDEQGTMHLVWQGTDSTLCGDVLDVRWERTSFLTQRVQLTTQTSIDAWEYIDAVQLVGHSSATRCIDVPRAPSPPPPPLPSPPPPLPPPCVSGSEQQQYAATATTSSEYGGSWTAADATGATTHSSCSALLAGSWAPGPRSTETHTLTLGFAAPLYMSGLEVWEAANPQAASGFVRRLDAIEPSGTSHLFWEENAAANDVDGTACGAVFSVSSPTTTSFLVSHVKITTRTNIRAWEYVDAVRMSGYACSSAVGGSVLATVEPPPSTKTVVLTLTASGSVSDYLDTSSLQESIADAAGVDKSLVTISVAAASVIITASIAVPASTTASAVQTSLSSKLATVEAASTVLGVTVESVPTVVMSPVAGGDISDNEQAQTDDGSNNIILMVAISLFVLTGGIALLMCWQRRRKARQNVVAAASPIAHGVQVEVDNRGRPMVPSAQVVSALDVPMVPPQAQVLGHPVQGVPLHSTAAVLRAHVALDVASSADAFPL